MRSESLITLAMAVVFGVALVASPVGAAQKSGEKTPMTDTWLTAKTKIALFADDRVKGRDVNVETQKSTVILRGKVNTDDAKVAAEDIAKGIDGVKGVKNELQVVQSSKRDVVDESDDAIIKRVKQDFDRDSQLKSTSISVKSNAGVVSLTGEVQDIGTSAKASSTAWNVPGVKSVKNDLMYKEDR